MGVQVTVAKASNTQRVLLKTRRRTQGERSLCTHYSAPMTMWLISACLVHTLATIKSNFKQCSGEKPGGSKIGSPPLSCHASDAQAISLSTWQAVPSHPFFHTTRSSIAHFKMRFSLSLIPTLLAVAPAVLAREPPTELQVGVKHKPEDCGELASAKGDKLSM